MPNGILCSKENETNHKHTQKIVKNMLSRTQIKKEYVYCMMPYL